MNVDEYFTNNYNNIRTRLINQYPKCEETIDEDLNDIYIQIKEKNIEVKSFDDYIFQTIYNRHYWWRKYHPKKYKLVYISELTDLIPSDEYDYTEDLNYEIIQQRIKKLSLDDDEYDYTEDLNYEILQQRVKKLSLDNKVLYDLYFKRGFSIRQIAKMIKTNPTLIFLQIKSIKEQLWED